MAGASMNDIKSRIKSVNSTMQITKAMELVATSKLRRAKERVERARPYYEILNEAIKSIENSRDAAAAAVQKKAASESEKTLFVVIAGDRGLAGGYNANIFRLTEALSGNKNAIYLPIGKKALEYYKHRNKELFSQDFEYVGAMGVGDSFRAAQLIYDAYREARISRVILVYTKFVSMITQTPVYEELLPFEYDTGGTHEVTDPIFEGEVDEILDKLLPDYVGGILYSAVCEALASESGARRSSMNAANKNAAEMIDTLMLKYNRARQAVITQEITEIVSGAEAL